FVELLEKVESIEFPTAGTFTAPSSLTVSGTNCSTSIPVSITFFNRGDEEFVKDPQTAYHRSGSDLRALLVSHIHGWMEKERKHTAKYNDGDSLNLSYFQTLLSMLSTLDQSGTFNTITSPIVLHHWDLVPRNIMVAPSPSESGLTITGIIDWDDALALPRALARRPADWIWDYNSERSTGYLDTDHHPKTNLDADSLALKAHFDAKAASTLGGGYLEDAYGSGRWLRRIWTFARGGVYSTLYLDLIWLLVKDWEKKLEGEREMASVDMLPEAEKVVPKKAMAVAYKLSTFSRKVGLQRLLQKLRPRRRQR
ncbi:MAG: hypothetical protein Q9223_000928, partial [Gallowayella weberi]